VKLSTLLLVAPWRQWFVLQIVRAGTVAQPLQHFM